MYVLQHYLIILVNQEDLRFSTADYCISYVHTQYLIIIKETILLKEKVNIVQTALLNKLANKHNVRKIIKIGMIVCHQNETIRDRVT